MDQSSTNESDVIEDDESLGNDISKLLESPDNQQSAEAVPHSAKQIPADYVSLLSVKPGRLQTGIPSPANDRIITNACPISMVSGEELLTQQDFELSGPILLAWQRTYRSSNSRDVGLGVGWTSSWFARLIVEKDHIIFHDGEGREIEFVRPANGEACYQAIEQLTLYCEGADYRIIDSSGTTMRFAGAKKRKRLEQVSNSYGCSIRLHYADSGRLSSMTDSTARSLRFEYNINGHLRLVHLLNADSQPVGQPLVQYRYSNASDLVTVIDAAGFEQHFVYEQHILVQRTTKDGFNFYLEWDQYDNEGKCIRNWGDSNVYAYEFEYDVENRITRSTDGRGYTSEYHYNELGLVTKETSPLGGVTEWEYDNYGFLVLERDPIGSETRYEYKDSQLVRMTNALQETTEYEYDAAGNCINEITPDGVHWRRDYDRHGKRVVEYDANGNATKYRYDTNGNLVSILDPAKNEALFEWNARAELVSQTDVLGDCTKYTYDELGRVTKVVQGSNRVTQYKYDRNGNITFVIHPDGSNSQLQYTAEGHLTHYIDPLGSTTQFRYDGLSQPVERIDPSGLHFRYIYDPERNLIALLNQNNDRFELRYDENQRVVMEIGFDGREQKYSYDLAGHLLSHADGLYRSADFKRDALGRIVRTESSSGGWSEFSYDRMGRLGRAVNESSEVLFSYDNNGRLTDEVQNGRRVQYRYDVNGNKTHIVLPNGQLIQFDFNAKGLYTCAHYKSKLTTLKPRLISKVVRNFQGRETKRQVGKKTTAMFAYDPMGRLVKHKLSNEFEPIFQRQYRYNKVGNLTRLDDSKRGTTQLRYDALDRIKLVMGFATEQFFFDVAGNIVDKKPVSGFEPGQSISHAAQLNADQVKGYQIRSYGDYHFDYDDVGNLISQHGEENVRYFYNDQNLLMRALVQDQIFEYDYDALGRRCRKRDAFGETEYVWNENVLLGEQRNSMSVVYVHEPGTHIPLCQIRDKQIYHYHNDHIGTPQILTDKNGEVVWDAVYKVFGAVANYAESFIDNPIRFQGQYLDTETGLHYNRNRYYHPGIGRFTNQDPIGLLGGENTYQYAPNPLRWVDPLGTRCKEAVQEIEFLARPQLGPDRSILPVFERRSEGFTPIDKTGKNNMARVWLWSLQSVLSDSYTRLYKALKIWQS